MPTVLRIGGLRFVIWPNDHGPAHVHVFSAEAEAKIELGEPDGHPRLIDNRRMKRSDLLKALKGCIRASLEADGKMEEDSWVTG